MILYLSGPSYRHDHSGRQEDEVVATAPVEVEEDVPPPRQRVPTRTQYGTLYTMSLYQRAALSTRNARQTLSM